MKLKLWAARLAVAGCCAFIAVFFALHALHITADFPNFSPWMDYAKYTDEGWYGKAAIAQIQRGSWYVPGDFNPAVALPVWPFLEWILFHFTGAGLVAARALAVAVFGGNLVLVYLLAQSQGVKWGARWGALLAAMLVSGSAFLYCFSRLAILEPLLVFLMLLSWLIAIRIRANTPPSRRIAPFLLLGLIFCLMVLTKTTAIFLFPAVCYLLWHSLSRRSFLYSSAIVLLTAATAWSTYYLALVRPHYLADYRYLFAINVYPQPSTTTGWIMAFWYAIHGVMWIDPTLAILAAALLFWSLLFARSLWRNPLLVACGLAIAGYVFFIGYHANTQPRYYQVVAFPLMLASALATGFLLQHRSRASRTAGLAALLSLGAVLALNARQTLVFALHPEYTFVDAARNLTRYVDRHPNGNRLLLSISGDNIDLVTGLPAICDDFGTLDLPARIRKYQPGWYAAWNEIDPNTLRDLKTQFTLEKVASFHAYDDEDRDELVLYKLHPLENLR